MQVSQLPTAIAFSHGLGGFRTFKLDAQSAGAPAGKLYLN
jgi:hypothetical protein